FGKVLLFYCGKQVVMQDRKYCFFGILMMMFFMVSFQSYGQSTRSVEEILEQRSAKQSTKKKKKKFSLFKKKGDSPFKTSADMREEYEDRMKANMKKARKEGRMSKKPQYSDPSYFGHKRPPKKRPPGKKKFCKECHIVH
ncbi:MAG: hypothetical protein AAFO69_18115, partial [Bacteroidota bacterium]